MRHDRLWVSNPTVEPKRQHRHCQAQQYRSDSGSTHSGRHLYRCFLIQGPPLQFASGMYEGAFRQGAIVTLAVELAHLLAQNCQVDLARAAGYLQALICPCSQQPRQDQGQRQHQQGRSQYPKQGHEAPPSWSSSC